jgi:hypothetical protein
MRVFPQNGKHSGEISSRTSRVGVNFRAMPQQESLLKKIAYGALFFLVMVALLTFTVLLMRGMVWASEKTLPWLVVASQIALAICIFIFLPLCIFRKTRPLAGLGFYIASFVFGVLLFALSCLLSVSIWGYGALIVGLVMGGVGVLPVALVATLFTARWELFIELIIGLVMTFGTR